LHWTVLGGHLQATELLLNYGAKVNSKDEDGDTPMHYACRNNNTDIITLLLNNGASPNIANKYGELPMHCTQNDHVKLLVLVAGAPPPKKQKELDFFDAAEVGHILTLQRLLKVVSPNIKGLWDRTPLMWACFTGQTQAAVLLLDNGAQIDLQDDSGWSCLHWACNNGHIATVNALLKYKPNVNLKSSSGTTPIQLTKKEQIKQLITAHINEGSASEKAKLTPENNNECVVCLDGPKQFILIPCGHLILCTECAEDLMKGNAPLCPVCRQAVKQSQRVYS